MDLRIRKKHSIWIKGITVVTLATIAILAPLVAAMIIILFVVSFIIARFVLAPKAIFFTIGREGTIQRIDKSGQRWFYILFWSGHIFRGDSEKPSKYPIRNWDIIEGEDPYWYPFGYLRFYGLWPWANVYEAMFAWSHWHANEKLKDHKDPISEFYAMLDDYGIQFGAENDFLEDLGGLPLSVGVVMPGQIINPERAIVLVKDWFGLVKNNIFSPATKQFIAKFPAADLYPMKVSKKTADLQKEKGIPETPIGTDLIDLFWQELKSLISVYQSGEKGAQKEGTFREVFVLDEGTTNERIIAYGVAFPKKGTAIKRVEPREDYRALTTKITTAKFEKDAAIIKGEQDLEVAKLGAKAEIVKGAEILTGIIAGVLGVDQKELKGIIESDPDIKKMFWGFATETSINQLAQMRGKYFRGDINIKGGGGMAGDIAGGIAAVVLALREISSQVSASGSQNTKEKSGKKATSEKKSKKTKTVTAFGVSTEVPEEEEEEE